jgi:hypothetical protein
MDAQFINKAVRDLLNQLVRELPGYRWDALCAFRDGKGKTVMELNVWRNDGQERAGHITYQMETGEVLAYHYPPLGKGAPEPVLDFLLDLYNMERRLSEVRRQL